MSRIQADLLLFLAAAIWGLAFVFQKTAMSDVGPYTFIAARAAVATILLVPFALLEGRRVGALTEPGVFHRVGALAGLMFFLGAALQQVGLKVATVTNAGFLTALYVVFVPFLAWGWSRQAPSLLIWISAALSFLGTWLLGGASVAAFNHGDLLILICSIFWALHMLVVGAAGRHARPILFTCVQFAVVTALAMIGAMALENPTLAGLRAAAPEIAYVGILSSAFTFAILSIALRQVTPAEGAIIVSTETLFAALAGALLLGERLGWINWIGAALIVVATLVIQLAPRHR